MVEEKVKSELEGLELTKECIIDISKYIAKTRAYPSILDGMKTSLRRLVYQSRKFNSLTKSQAVIGEWSKIHPHELSSGVLYGAATRFSNFPLYHTQGNFGDNKSDSGASPRYTSCYLNDIARLCYLDLLDYSDYEEGEVEGLEPRYFPALIPYCYIQGASGMSMGMSPPNIPSFNSLDLINYYIDLLEGKSPKNPRIDFGEVFVVGSKKDTDNLLNNGGGKISYSPSIKISGNDLIVSKDLPPRRSIDRALKKIQEYIDDDIVDYLDQGNEGYLFKLNKPKKLSMTELHSKIHKALCSSDTYRILLECDGKVYKCSFSYVVKCQLEYLRKCVVRKCEDFISKSSLRINVLSAINELKKSDLIDKLSKIESQEIVDYLISKGFSEEVSKEVPKKPISYLTKSHDKESKELIDSVKENEEYKNNPDLYLLGKYKELKVLVENIYNSREHTEYLS